MRPPRSSFSCRWASASSFPGSSPSAFPRPARLEPTSRGQRMSTTPDEASSPAHGSGRSDLMLLGILSVLAGLVDVIGFLRLGHVFTAHITGNLVVMADEIANGGPPHVAQVLSIPVFVIAVVIAYVLVIQ